MQSVSPFLARLGLRVPIIQAPMAGVSTPELAAAVSNSGALGSLGIGASAVSQARDAIRRTKSLTRHAFNVNVFCHAPAVRDLHVEAAWLAHLAPLFAEAGIAPPNQLAEIYTTFLDDDEMLAMLIGERPAVVSFHFGLPAKDRIQALRDAGIYTLATATNLAEAGLVEASGVDAIVAQGVEAGGHRGTFDLSVTDEHLSTAVLVRLLATHTTLPVIAAGGIMDGQGIRAMLTLGASAAQLGTAFILCPESAANAEYRANLKSERAAVTRLTSAVSGRPARGIVNTLIEHGERDGHPVFASYPVAYDAAKQLHSAAAKSGNHTLAAHWAGQGAPLARDMPANELIAALVAELQ